jgi:hypothetical protein
MAEEAGTAAGSVSLLSLVDVFGTIHAALENASTPEEIESLHRRALWLAKIINAPAWEENFGDDIAGVRRAADDGVAEATRAAQRRAEEIGVRVTLGEAAAGDS